MKFFFVFQLVFITVLLTNADVPVREEQLIYSIMAFNGKDYSSTFCNKNSDTIYLIADQDSFIAVRKTFVYFWPITNEWKADVSTLNFTFDGTIQLNQKNSETRFINPEYYTFYNKLGKYEQNWEVAVGENAELIVKNYQRKMAAYQRDTEFYEKEKESFDFIMDKIVRQIEEIRKTGTDISGLLEELKKMKAPLPPIPPNDYIVPPSPVQQAFIINLPVGEYDISFINTDGTLMEGSEKHLVVFEKHRSNGIGFELIPGDKWTRPVESKNPSSVLYVDGSTDLYLRPFYQEEFNDLYYKKMQDNNAKGNSHIMNWVHIQQVPDSRLLLSGESFKDQIIYEQPFFVQQKEGAALGYQIVPYDKEGVHKENEPSLIAFHIPLKTNLKSLKFRLQSIDGNDYAGSSRQIRVINKFQKKFMLLFFTFIPLITMFIIRRIRSRVYVTEINKT